MVDPEAQPDLLILPPLEPEEPSFVSFVERCIERGYFFPFDRAALLPASLPDDLSGFKAIILDPRVEWGRADQFKRRVAAFVENGGEVFELEPVDSFTRELDNPMRGLLDCDLPVAGVRRDHPGLRARLGGRDDGEFLRELVDAAFDPRAHRPILDRGSGVADRFTKEGDVGIYWSRRPMLLAGRYLQDGAVLDRLRQYVDLIIATRSGPPAAFYGVADAVVFLHFHRASGDERYLRYVEQRAEHLVTNVRRVEGVMTYHSWFSGEACAMLSPGLTALGGALGRDVYVEEALALLRLSYERLFDPTDGLWFHGVAPGEAGQKAAAKWGRGQGWALYGIAHTLEVLPRDHPARDWLCARLDEAAHALRSLQDPHTGCWHNVLTEPLSGLESSATSIFVEVFSLAWKEGWCRLDFVPEMVRRGWTGIKCRTYRNRTVGWAPGTGLSPDLSYYITRPRVSQPSFIIGSAVRYLEAFGAP